MNTPENYFNGLGSNTFTPKQDASYFMVNDHCKKYLPEQLMHNGENIELVLFFNYLWYLKLYALKHCKNINCVISKLEITPLSDHDRLLLYTELRNQLYALLMKRPDCFRNYLTLNPLILEEANNWRYHFNNNSDTPEHQIANWIKEIIKKIDFLRKNLEDSISCMTVLSEPHLTEVSYAVSQEESTLEVSKFELRSHNAPIVDLDENQKSRRLFSRIEIYVSKKIKDGAKKMWDGVKVKVMVDMIGKGIVFILSKVLF